MTSSGLVHSLHSPKGHCANCAVKMPGSHNRALCTDCATVQSPRQKHAAAIRRSLAKCDPGMLALADACKATFGARMDGLTLPHDDGTVGGAGKFAPDSDLWNHWPEGQR